MGELIGAALFGWIWVALARVLLWPFGAEVRRNWTLILAVLLTGGLASLSYSSGNMEHLSPVGLVVSLLSLGFFLHRNRYRAAREAGVEPVVTTWDGRRPVGLGVARERRAPPPRPRPSSRSPY
jgi:hypothetical protein